MASVGILFSFVVLNIDTLCQCYAVTLLHVVPCNVIIADIESTGICPLLRDVGDPNLIRLAEELPNTLLKSRADFSVKKYLGIYHRWRTWATA